VLAAHAAVDHLYETWHSYVMLSQAVDATSESSRSSSTFFTAWSSLEESPAYTVRPLTAAPSAGFILYSFGASVSEV
jgi:hypothetical protein